MAQLITATKLNRYAGQFELARLAWGAESSPRILSFGCSSGDEMVSIRKYFPSSEVLGCDIDLQVAEARRDLPGEVFVSTPENIQDRGNFDIVFANSVLCLHPIDVPVPSKFPFSEFQALVESLDSALNYGGILGIYNSSYLFRELPFSDNYRPLRSISSFQENGHVPKWTAEGRRISSELKMWPFRFQLIEDVAEVQNGDFTDILFRKSPGEPELFDGRIARSSTSKWKDCGAVESRIKVVSAIISCLTSSKSTEIML